MNILALLITVLIPPVHINENELNESLRCVSLQRCPSLALCPMPGDLAGTTNVPPDPERVPRTATQTSWWVCVASVYDSLAQEGKSWKGGVCSFLLDGWQEGGKKVVEMWDVGVEDVMSSHGLTTPSLVAGRPAPPPQCLLNSGCLLVPVRSVPIPLSFCCVPATSLAWLSCCWIL